MKRLVPYQIFFPLGLLNAFLAVGVWFVRDLGWLPAPSLLIHSKLIMGGFLWSFIVGFLMTAVPRMTGTDGASRLEVGGSVLLMAALMILSWGIDPRPFYAVHVALVVFLLIYAGRRLLTAKKPVPVFFSHVGLAMVLALAGAVAHFRGNSFLGIHLYHVGAVLLLVLGLGTRFFSFLSGLASAFEGVTETWKILLFHVCGLLTAASLFLAGEGFASAYLALSVLGLIYLFAIWRVQRPSARPSALKHGVRIVAAMIPLSFFLTWLKPYLFVTWFHFLFIGCFGLITFSVATRVTLAHGAYPIDLEMKSKSLRWTIGLLVAGLATRALYGFAGDVWWGKSWLHLAATFWILGVGVWCFAFLMKIFRPGPQAAPSC